MRGNYFMSVKEVFLLTENEEAADEFMNESINERM
jgi:hypothetical protein